MKLYYCRKSVGDVLIIIKDDKAFPNKVVRKDNVVSLYRNDNLVGINIFDFSKISRIFIEGEIVDPSIEFITLVNHILRNANIDTLLEA